MISLSIKELLKVLNAQLLNPGSDFLEKEFTGVSIDTRTLAAGNLFVALSGEKQDGHDFLTQAINQRASALLVQQGKFKRLEPSLIGDTPFIQVKDTRAGLQELAWFYRRKFSLPVVAITGSNGKTTTKEMVAKVLGSKYQVLKSHRSFNTLIGVPLTIFELSPQTEYLILEMGTSQPGEISKLAELAVPTAALILNIAPAHLESFGTLEKVAKAKFELLEHLPKDKPVFLNLDDPFLAKRAHREKHPVISFALNALADYRALDVIISGNGHIDFRVRQSHIRLNLLGRHNIYNALAAYAVAEYFKLPASIIASSLEGYQPAHLRMEVQKIRGAEIINDCYNANPVSMLAALESLASSTTSGRRIAVLADMLELGKKAKEFHEKAGEEVAKLGIDYLVTVGELAENIAISARKRGMSKDSVRSFLDKQETAGFLRNMIMPGDTVLFKGSRRVKLEEIIQLLGRENIPEN